MVTSLSADQEVRSFIPYSAKGFFSNESYCIVFTDWVLVCLNVSPVLPWRRPLHSTDPRSGETSNCVCDTVCGPQKSNLSFAISGIKEELLGSNHKNNT